APFVLARELGRRMVERGRGKIIFVASMLSFQGGINVPGYAASKGGVAQLTKALANEWAAHGVNVNAVAPGYIATDNTTALPADDADEAVSACRALLAGGISVVEVTFRTAAAADAIRAAAELEGLLVGAGTVRSKEQLLQAIEAGARFGVAPGLDPDVLEA